MSSGQSIAAARARRAHQGRAFPGSDLHLSRLLTPGSSSEGEDAAFVAAGVRDATFVCIVETTAAADGLLFSVGTSPRLSAEFVGGDLVVSAGGDGDSAAVVTLSSFAITAMRKLTIAVRPATGTLWVWVDGVLAGRVDAASGFPGGVWTDGVGYVAGVLAG